MGRSSNYAAGPRNRLSRIVTRWSVLERIIKARSAAPVDEDGRRAAEELRNAFVLQYAASIRHYAGGLVKDDVLADDLAQEVITRMISGAALPRVSDPGRGRFRAYLKTVIRRQAMACFRRKRPVPIDLEAITSTGAPPDHDHARLLVWRKAIFDAALHALEQYQEAHQPGNHFHRVIRLAHDRSDETKEQWAAYLNERLGLSLTADAVRQQLKRARREFAGFLVDEVARSLRRPTPERVEDRLIELSLHSYVRDFLPEDWHVCGVLLDVV